jgi:hypothetical protein
MEMARAWDWAREAVETVRGVQEDGFLEKDQREREKGLLQGFLYSNA